MNARMMWNQSVDGNLFNVGWRFLDMLYNVDSITQACYTSFKEAGINFYQNALYLTPRSFLDNFIFNFGDIFDALRDVSLFMKDDPRGEYDVPYDAGYGLGTAVFLIIKPPNY